ncbi:383_t:CDS:1 [Paraglomus occultum]|uniref:383_t:CDS:1 n=1 Tax=Paraglomus occultum TaxID=144539 RepID=A0A9N8ZX51_9GLOM|nr:383_t:CDS:1 [Paraglomus occultum]
MSNSKLGDIESNISALLEVAQTLALMPSKKPLNKYLLFRNSVLSLAKQHRLPEYSAPDLKRLWHNLAPNLKNLFQIIAISTEHTPTIVTKVRAATKKRAKRQHFQHVFEVQEPVQGTLNMTNSRYPRFSFVPEPSIRRLKQDALFGKYTNNNDY